MKRLFLAFDLTDEAREVVAGIQKKVKTQFEHSDINWVPPEQFHVTVHFLGETDERMILKLTKQLNEVSYPPQFELFLDGLDAFPDKKEPKTMYVRTSFRTEAFGVVKRSANVLAGLGVPLGKRPWKPHITIGRVKKQAEVFKPREIEVPEVSFDVGHFTLYESQLTHEGSEYSAIETFSL